MLKSFIFRKHSIASSNSGTIHLGFIVLYFHHFLSGVFNQLWEIENRSEILHMGLESFRGVNKLQVFVTETETCASCASPPPPPLPPHNIVNLNIDLPFSPCLDHPYWSINRQDVRLKSSSISPRGPNWSWRSEDVYVSIGLLLLWIQQNWWMCMCSSHETILLSGLTAFFFSKPAIFIFHDPQNKFKCLLSSSNQTEGDILEKKWNKMLCD